MTLETCDAVVFDRGFDAFINSLRDPAAGATAISPKRLGDLFNLDLQTLASFAHVHRNTMQRAPASESVQRYLRDVLRVLRAAADVSGDLPQALFWYRNSPLPLFDYKTPEQLVSDGRCEDLLRYVAALDAGAAG